MHFTGKISKFDFTKCCERPEKGPKNSKKRKGQYTRGQNTVKNCNWGCKQAGRGGGLLPPSLYVKRGPAVCYIKLLSTVEQTLESEGQVTLFITKLWAHRS